MTSPTLADLRPGDILFARHVSPKSADLLILAGQTFLGEPGYPHHVAVVSSVGAPWVGDVYGTGKDVQSNFPREGSTPTVRIVQAMPSGAEEVKLGQEHWTRDYTYIRPEYGSGQLPVDPEAVAWYARKYIDTPYSFLDYAALTGRHLLAKQPQDRTLLDRYVTSSKHQICSQLADQAMSDAGWHVFDDGRLAQDVTPSSLYAQMLKMPGQHLVPGSDWVPNVRG